MIGNFKLFFRAYASWVKGFSQYGDLFERYAPKANPDPLKQTRDYAEECVNQVRDNLGKKEIEVIITRFEVFFCF